MAPTHRTYTYTSTCTHFYFTIDFLPIFFLADDFDNSLTSCSRSRSHLTLCFVLLCIVIDSYGLTPDADEDKMDDGNKKWKVDESLLTQDTKKNESVHEGVDLPAKKDFVKRAKLVISRTILKMRSGTTNSKVISSTKTTDDDTKSSAESNGYILIDQGNRCNILLAELCRGVIIGSTKNAVQLRQMVSNYFTAVMVYALVCDTFQFSFLLIHSLSFHIVSPSVENESR